MCEIPQVKRKLVSIAVFDGVFWSKRQTQALRIRAYTF